MRTKLTKTGYGMQSWVFVFICNLSPSPLDCIPHLPASYRQYLPNIMGSFYTSENINIHAIYFAFEGSNNNLMPKPTLQISICHTDIPGHEDDEILNFFEDYESQGIILDTLLSLRILLYFAQKPNVDIAMYINKKCRHRCGFPVSIMRNRQLERDMYKESPVDVSFFLPMLSRLLRPEIRPIQNYDQRVELALNGQCFSDDEWLQVKEWNRGG